MEKLTHDELTERLDEPGWRTIAGNKAMPLEGTLRQMVEAAHERHKQGRAAGLLQHIATQIEIDMIQLENLWHYLGLPV